MLCSTSLVFIPCRIYSDGLTKDSKQSLISWLVAVTTLTIYTGWAHVLIALIIASFFSRTALYITLALWSTVLLPARPVLWNAFCRYGCAEVPCSGAGGQRYLQEGGSNAGGGSSTCSRGWGAVHVC